MERLLGEAEPIALRNTVDMTTLSSSWASLPIFLQVYISRGRRQVIQGLINGDTAYILENIDVFHAVPCGLRPRSIANDQSPVNHERAAAF